MDNVVFLVPIPDPTPDGNRQLLVPISDPTPDGNRKLLPREPIVVLSLPGTQFRIIQIFPVMQTT